MYKILITDPISDSGLNIFDNDKAGKVGVKKLAERLFIEV